MAKRLFSKLQALESASGQQTGLTHNDKRLLVALLARRDALFWPWRWTQKMSDRFPELLRRQREYLSGETGLSAKASGGKGSWKISSERRQKLIDAGHLKAAYSGGQVASVFLTATGEAIARALAGWLADVPESMPTLKRLYELSDGRPNIPIRESILWEHPCVGCPDEWNHLTERILPALTAGIVGATSDTTGRIAYGIVADAKMPELVTVEQEREEWASDTYIATFNAERASLESLTPSNTTEVWIPLPATGWGKHHLTEANDANP